jgi:hypothetical protein
METKITVTELNNGKCFIELQQEGPPVIPPLYIDKVGCLHNYRYAIDSVEKALEVVDKFKERRRGNQVKRIVLEETLDV